MKRQPIYTDYFKDKEQIDFYKNNIIAFCEDFFEETKLTKRQKNMLEIIQQNKFIKDFLFRSEGSTFIICLASLWYLTVYYKSKILITDGFNNQQILDNNLWLEMKKCFNIFLLKDIFKMSNQYIKMKEDRCWFISKRRCRPEEIQGFLAENIMIACDNAKFINERVYDCMVNTIVSPSSKLVLLG